jgi:hypothetical protein
MAYDPSLPVNNSSVTATELRGQFGGLFDLIQTIPVGPEGPQGPQGIQGVSVTGAVVDAVTTVSPGGAATAGASFDGANVHFSFGIPQGEAGPTGAPGPQGVQGDVGPQGPAFTNFTVTGTTTLNAGDSATVATSFDGATVGFSFGIPRGADGAQGPAGSTGPTGPPFTNFTVDSVTTLAPFQPATVAASFDGTFVRFAFGIPQGVPGNNGADGATGPQGPQGPPGEVSAAELASAIAGTASNTNPIATLGIAISDPPTQSEVEQVLAKLNELIVALRR